SSRVLRSKAKPIVGGWELARAPMIFAIRSDSSGDWRLEARGWRLGLEERRACRVAEHGFPDERQRQRTELDERIVECLKRVRVAELPAEVVAQLQNHQLAH